MTKHKLEDDFRTPFAKAKGDGSSKSGSHHFLMQRLTAVILAFSVLWVFCLGCSLPGKAMSEVVEILKCPCNIIALMIFSITGFYHGALGMQVIIEDYVSCICGRYFLIITVKIFSFVTIVASLAALTYLMVL